MGRLRRACFFIDIVTGIKVFDASGKPGWIVCARERFDRGNTAFSREKLIIKVVNIVSKAGNDPHSCNYNSSFCHRGYKNNRATELLQPVLFPSGFSVSFYI